MQVIQEIEMERGPHAVASLGNLVFAANEERVSAYILTDGRLEPAWSQREPDADFRSVFASRGLLFAASIPTRGNGNVYIYEAETGEPVGRWGDGETVIHGIFGLGSSLVLAGSDGTHGRVVLLNLEDPGNPSLRAVYRSSTDKGYGRPWAGEGALYFCDARGSLLVLDPDGGAPSVNREGVVANAWGRMVVGDGRFLYMANYGAGLFVFDISEPKKPRLAGVLREAGLSVYGVAVKGERAFVAGGWAGLLLVDVSDPSAMKVLSRLKPRYTTYTDVALAGEYVVCADKGGFTNKPGIDLIKT